VVELDSISTLKTISEKVAPGRQPGYISAHVLKTLEIIESELGVGRQQLAKRLDLGEGSARTMVKHLRNNGLLEISRKGMILTDEGRELLNEIRKRITSTEIHPTGLTVSNNDYAVLIRGVTSRIKSGVEQRDSALLAGAKGATTLIYRGDKFHVPSMNVETTDTMTKELIARLRPQDGDVIVIGTADTPLQAEIGAKAAALAMLV
jgi:DNA-binding transcriptional regulator LsrR (DeoR family)